MTVYDQSSYFPLHDVYVNVYCSGYNYDSLTNEKAYLVTHPSLCGQFFTNKKGKFQTDLFDGQDSTSYIISFIHENYAVKRVNYDSLVNREFKVFLESNANTLDEMVVSASRMNEKKKDVIQKIRVIQSHEIQNQNQSSMADLIDNSGNVFVQKSQLGGGSPIIRGFETNKILMVVDGVRMNNAIYRGGHLQNIITLDNSIMDRVEVLFGPGSVVYGSDAIGGVMSFTTKDPKLSHKVKPLVLANGYTRYFSAANGFATNVHVSVANKKFGSLSSATFSKFGDLRQGSNRTDLTQGFGERNWYVTQANFLDTMLINTDPNLQVGSAYQQLDLLQKFIYRQNEFLTHKLNFQLSNSSNIDRYDRLTQMENGVAKYAEWYYGPQYRFLSSYTFEYSKSNKWYDNAKFIAAYQAITESRMVRKYQDDELKSRIEDLDIFTINIDFSKDLTQRDEDGELMSKHELNYGLDVSHNIVGSTAYSTKIFTLEKSALDTRYPDGGSDMSSFAMYCTDTWEFNRKMVLNAGIRASHVRLNALFIDQTFFPFPFNSINQQNSSVNGNLGLIYMPKRDIRFTLSSATGFRAPNVDDVSKVFESVPGKVIVPNPDLKPEYSYNLELGSEINLLKKLKISANVFGTFLTNALTVQNTSFNGEDSILYEGTYSQVITTTNANRAYVMGVEGVLSGNIGKYLNVYSTINYTYGRILTDSIPYPLDHIPPLFGKISLKYQKKKISSELFFNYSAWKRLEDYNLVGEDNYAFALPQGMPSWYTLNLRCNYSFSKNLSLQVACENIFDQNYRKFASNISSPGRNFILTLRGTF
ncbi:TonB-dependent receptor [Crocinitomicaceae bacterium]|nr:TonB-dependent receptor [Crocinitomicaceae bacterium]